LKQAIKCFLGLCFICLPVFAEETLPSLEETVATINGKDVTVAGWIGSGLVLGDDEAISFALEDRTTFKVIFDAGRDARRQLEGCEFKFFGGTPCPAVVNAEIEIDGSNIKLIVFDLIEIGAPAKF